MHAIKTNLWPTPGHFLAGKVSPLSILAFHIQIMSQPGNLLDGKQGLYFFRDSSLPTPRAASFAAWRSLVGLGGDSSPYFLVPFLPSIRNDEEAGISGSLRGSGDGGSNHLTTLTRKSRLHVKDSNGFISWGAVYVGSRDHPEDPLRLELGRSDISESFIIPRKYQSGDKDSRAHGSLRTRLEFLAQFGIPAINTSTLPLAPVRRVLYQCLEQSQADSWARAYCAAGLDFESNELAESQDFAQLLTELMAYNLRKEEDSASDSIPGVERTDNQKLSGRKKKIKFGDFELTL